MLWYQHIQAVFLSNIQKILQQPLRLLRNHQPRLPVQQNQVLQLRFITPQD
ncbi:MAG: hypothetical protein ACTSPV_14480 [Candidatus Hodarchaeales archaeon]